MIITFVRDLGEGFPRFSGDLGLVVFRWFGRRCGEFTRRTMALLGGFECNVLLVSAFADKGDRDL